MEAPLLLEAKAAYSIKDYAEFEALLDKMLADDAFLKQTGANAGNYVISNAGATDKVMRMINF